MPGCEMLLTHTRLPSQPRGGLFKKPCDPVLSVQLMKSQHGDSDDPVGLLDGAEAVRAVVWCGVGCLWWSGVWCEMHVVWCGGVAVWRWCGMVVVVVVHG
jgi:hypothetical protein